MAGQNYNVTINYSTGDTSALKTIEEIKQDLLDISQSKGIPADKMTPELQKAASAADALLKSLDAAENKKLGKINISSFTSTLKSYGYSIDEAEKSLLSLGETGKQVYGNLNRKLVTVGATTLQTNKFLETAYDTIVKTARWNISSNIVNSISGSIQRAFGYIEDLNESVTNIRIVTGYSADEMERFAKSANESAKALGKTTLDYSDAALIYFQQGKTADQVEKLTSATIKAANVSQSTAEDMSDYLTAVWNGYKINAENSEAAVDKLSAVAAKTGADLSELSIGMSKVASAANNMGVDMDQMNAILATITTVTREAPETVGTTLKTVLSRMTDLTLGETDEDGIDFGAVAKELSKVGIQIANSDGELKDLGVTIEQVGGRWKTFTREQQISIAQAMAGTRQYSRLISLYDNWDMYEDALKVSKDALGTLDEQNAIYLESFEAASEKLSASLEGLWGSLIDSDAMKFGVDTLSLFINGLDELVQLVGGAGPTFALLGVAMTQVFGKKMAQQILLTSNNLKVLFEISEQRKNFKANLEKIAVSDEVSDSYKKLAADIAKVSNSMSQADIVATKANLEQIEMISKTIAKEKEKLLTLTQEKEKIEELMRLRAANGEAQKVTTINSDSALFLANVLSESQISYSKLTAEQEAFYQNMDEKSMIAVLKEEQKEMLKEKVLLEKIGAQITANRRLLLSEEEKKKSPLSIQENIQNGKFLNAEQVAKGQALVNKELQDIEFRANRIKTVSADIAQVIKINEQGLEPYVQDIDKINQGLDESNKEIATLEGLTKSGALNNARIEKLNQGLNVLTGSLFAGTGAASTLKGVLEGTAEPITTLTSGVMSLASGIGSAATAFKTLGASAGVFSIILMVLPLAIELVNELVVTQDELIEKNKQLSDSIASTSTEIEGVKDSIESNNETIKELRDIIDSGMGSLVEDEQIEALKEQNEQLAIQLSYLEKINEQNNKDRDDVIEEYVDKDKSGGLKLGYGFDEEGNYANLIDVIMGKSYDTKEESINARLEKYEKLKKKYEEFRLNEDPEDDSKFTEKEQKQLDELEESLVEAGNEYAKMQSQYSDTTSDVYKYLSDMSSSILSTIDPEKLGLNKLSEMFNNEETKESISTLLDGIVDNEDYRNMDEFKIVMAKTGLGAIELDNALKDLAQSEDWASKNAEAAEEAYEAFNDKLEDVIESSKTVRGGLDDVGGALEDQKENGSLSADSIISLVESGYALALSLDEQTGKIVLNEAAMQRLAKEKIRNQILDIKTAKSNIIETLGAQATAVNTLATGFLKYNYQLAKTAEIVSAMTNYNSLNAEQLALEKLMKGIDDGTTFKSSGGGGSNTDAHLEAYEKERAALDHMYAMGRISAVEYYKDIEGLNDKYFKGRKKYIDKERALLEETYKGLKQAYEEILNEEKDKLDKVLSYVERVIDKQIESIEGQKKEVEEYYELQIKNLELLIKTKQQEIDDLKTANEERQAAVDLQKELYELNKLNEQRENYVYKDGQMVYETDQVAIREQQSVIDDQMYQSQIKALEDVINLLESQITTWEEKVTASNEAFDKQIESLELYKEKWTAIAEQQAEQEEESIALALYGANMRDQILNGSLDIIQLFSDDYKSITDGLALIAQANADNMGSIVGQMTGAAARAIQAAKDIAEANAKIQASTGVDYGGGGSGNGNGNLPATSSFSGPSKSLAARISADAKAPTSINSNANKVLNKIPTLSTNTNAFTTINRAIESNIEVKVIAPNLTNAAQMEGVLNAAFGQAAATMHKKVLEIR